MQRKPASWWPGSPDYLNRVGIGEVSRHLGLGGKEIAAEFLRDFVRRR